MDVTTTTPCLPVEEDIRILSTQYAPDVEEAQAIKSRCIVRQQELLIIEDALWQFERRLERRPPELRARRAFLQRSCDVGKGLLAPIRKLPTKILAEILTLCIPSCSPLDDQRLDRLAPRPHVARRCLGLVCHQWRAVSLQTPLIWATLVFNEALPATVDKFLGYVQELLARSRSSTLEIYLWPRMWFVKTGWDAPYASRLMRILSMEVSRFRQFYCYLRTQDGLLDLFPAGVGICTEAPNLEIFTLDWDESSLFCEVEIGDINAPKLRSLSLSDPTLLKSFVTTSFATLRWLSISRYNLKIPTMTLLHCLAQFPHLENLHLFGDNEIARALDDTAIARPPITVPLLALKKLVFSPCDSLDFSYFMRSINIPHLDTLFIGASFYDTPIVLFFDSPAAPVLGMNNPVFDSAVSLRHLKLVGAYLAGASARSFLQNLANLQTLQFIGCVFEKEFITALTPDSPDPSAWLCPRLMHLSFHRGVLPSVALLHLIRLRTRPDVDGHLSGYLMSINVVHEVEAEYREEFRQLRKTRAATLTCILL